MAEERVVLAGVSAMAAVAGQTHKHLGTVTVTASRKRPVRASLLIAFSGGDVTRDRTTTTPLRACSPKKAYPSECSWPNGQTAASSASYSRRNR